MRLLVIGASRGIGAEAVRLGLMREHEVRAFARSAMSLPEEPGLERIAGDATKAGDVAAAVNGVDAVLLCLGLPKGAGALARPTTLFSSATEVVLDAMRAIGVQRLIAVTGFGAGDSRAAVGRIMGLPFEAVMGRAYADKTRQETLIRNSGTDWTLVRPGILTGGAMTGRYRVLTESQSWRLGLIGRRDVAHFILGAVEAGTHIHEAPVLIR
ncbi:NAD(P)-dependent oxidoreductase [Histidinibacterium lentulum]|uniref:NAD(P)-dependent oxidoreductase n=1 Tax=Histidinibacterium lentulum TaxID=2480588 RepID=A0A3N2R6B7_9RHOB|nr:NAD(P)H-binding protein [Histidinibacterium lentulum]ROU02943.1 NAD(P)-dependent oxidoreductase [Histidinibacterium lentulum]